MVTTQPINQSGARGALALLSKAADYSPKNGPQDGWRAYVEPKDRQNIRSKIVRCLLESKPNAPQAVVDRLPALGARIEQNLFKVASSAAEYLNESTLKMRMAFLQQQNTSKLLNKKSPKGTPERLSDSLATDLFRALQVWRQTVVSFTGIPPWEICSNAVLAEISRFAPESVEELKKISGAEEKKMEKYGQALVNEIAQFLKTNKTETETSKNTADGTTNKRPRSQTRDSSVVRTKKRGKDTPAQAETPTSKASPSRIFPFQSANSPLPQLPPGVIVPPIPNMPDRQLLSKDPAMLWQQYEEEIRKLRFLLVQTQQENFRLRAELDLAQRQVRIQARSVSILPKEK